MSGTIPERTSRFAQASRCRFCTYFSAPDVVAHIALGILSESMSCKSQHARSALASEARRPCRISPCQDGAEVSKEIFEHEMAGGCGCCSCCSSVDCVVAVALDVTFILAGDVAHVAADVAVAVAVAVARSVQMMIMSSVLARLGHVCGTVVARL